ncbi:YdjY domain-containing protein [Rhodopirellula sp.]|mgnify:CR=1 FL=1|nr:YdjY domain-containing protein [Rhodopirellula sp.]MDB4561448.1 YdjY domain-containing protein [bacterium]
MKKRMPFVSALFLMLFLTTCVSANVATARPQQPRTSNATGQTASEAAGNTPPANNQTANPGLPELPQPGDPDKNVPAEPQDTATQEEIDAAQNAYISPATITRRTLNPPPNGTPISKNHLWVDAKNKRVILDGYVAMTDGPLEMFACPEGTKEHESIIGTLARSKEVHAALLAVGTMRGTPVEFLPKFVPATGQRVRLWVCYRDKDGEFKAVDGRRWVKKASTGKQMEPDWVFSGSGFWKDPDSGKEFYRADSGDMICVSNFNSAMMDVPVASSAEAGDLLFLPFTERIPPQGTPLRLVLTPIPLHTDKPTKPEDKTDTTTPPDKSIMPLKDPIKTKPSPIKPKVKSQD